MTRNRLTFAIALLAMTVVLAGVAQARTILVVHYSGQTSQKYKGKASPSIAIDVDRTHGAVYYIGIAFKCSNTGKAWITRIRPSVKTGKISRSGDFKYTVAKGKSRLSWISGHVTSRRITGKFAAKQLGCQAQGTYTATVGAK